MHLETRASSAESLKALAMMNRWEALVRSMVEDTEVEVIEEATEEAMEEATEVQGVMVVASVGATTRCMAIEEEEQFGQEIGLVRSVVSITLRTEMHASAAVRRSQARTSNNRSILYDRTVDSSCFISLKCW